MLSWLQVFNALQQCIHYCKFTRKRIDTTSIYQCFDRQNIYQCAFSFLYTLVISFTPSNRLINVSTTDFEPLFSLTIVMLIQLSMLMQLSNLSIVWLKEVGQ